MHWAYEAKRRTRPDREVEGVEREEDGGGAQRDPAESPDQKQFWRIISVAERLWLKEYC